VPHTALYSYTDSNFQQSLAGLHEARRLIKERYGSRPPFASDVAEDEKTLKQSASTLVSAAVSSEWDGTYIAKLQRLNEAESNISFRNI
jgi:hypothetical protein